MCDSLPLQLPTMTFNNIESKRKNSIKFLGVIIDENLTWKNHIEVLDHARPLLKEMNALNVYQINLIQTLKIMHKTKYGKNSRIFLPKFREVDHQYPTRVPQNSFCYKRSACKTTSFAITLRGLTIWSSSISQHKKSIPDLLSFLRQIKFKLLIAMSDVILLFICLSICFSSMLNIAPSDSLVDKLTSISDLNDLLVLDDKVCEPSTSSYHINISIS